MTIKVHETKQNEDFEIPKSKEDLIRAVEQNTWGMVDTGARFRFF